MFIIFNQDKRVMKKSLLLLFCFAISILGIKEALAQNEQKNRGTGQGGPAPPVKESTTDDKNTDLKKLRTERGRKLIKPSSKLLTPTLIFSNEWLVNQTLPARDGKGTEFFNFEIPANKIQSLPNNTTAELGCVATMLADKGEKANVTLKISGSQRFNLSPSNFSAGSFDTGGIKAFRLTKGQKYSFKGSIDDEKATFIKIMVEIWSPRIPAEHRKKFRNSPK